MAYDESKFTQFAATQVSSSAPNMWRYTDTSSTLATMKAADFFQLTETDTNLMLLAQVDDLVYLQGSDGTDWVKFSSVSDPVTVAGGADVVSLEEGDLAVGDSNDELSALSGTAGQIVQFDASANAVSASMTGDVTLSNTAVASVARVLDGSNAANVADVSPVGGLPILIPVQTVSGATANIDITVTHKLKVIDAWVNLQGAGTASDTIQVLNGASAISDAMDINVADESVVRAGTLNDANSTIAAAGTLRVTVTDGGGADVPACEVYILAINIA